MKLLHPDFALADKATYRVAEIAKGMGLSRQAVYDAINRGEMKCYKMGKRCTLVPRADLLAWIESLAHDPNA